ncbi:hypothetical protein L9F63_000320, partial [Diploptera punctata]
MEDENKRKHVSGNKEYSSQETNNPILLLVEMLHLVGMWSKYCYSRYKTWLYNTYSTVIVIVWIFNTWAGFMYCFKEPELDLHDLIIAIFIALGEETSLAGAFALLTGRNALENIIKMIDEGFKEYPLQLKLKWDKKARIITKFINIMWFIWGLLYAATPIIKSLFGDAKSGDSVKRDLPFLSWYPFDTNQSPVYEIIYFVHTFGLQYGIVPVSVFYSLFLFLTMFIEQQFEFVSNSLKNMK